MLAALYFHHLKIDPARPDWPERDRFLLSKGHAAAALYSALAQRGFFPAEDLERWGHVGAHLQGHPDRLKTPGVEMSSGFLGTGCRWRWAWPSPNGCAARATTSTS